jgi:ABC-2 type transport system ATP-binding protein
MNVRYESRMKDERASVIFHSSFVRKVASVGGVVNAEGVGKRYGALVALTDFTVIVHAGEVLGVLGPNGAGKTTAIRVLTTILTPSYGSFSIDGIPHTRPQEIRRRIGVLPESAGYPERQTGDEYLRYHARLHGHSRASAAAVTHSLLEEVGLAERGRSLIGSYSRGMRQRLGIARSLVNDPRVVVLDEPTLGLDPAGQRQILGNVRRIASERGAAVLLCTHLLAEVEENCSRVLILNRGRVVSEGTVADVARRAAAPRSGRLQVTPEHEERAMVALTRTGAVKDVQRDGRSGVLRLVLAGSEPSLNDAVRALVDADVSIISFELEGARLSDAFLAITEEA